MTSARDILTAASGLLLTSGGALYIGIGGAANAVAALQRNSIVVLGMEGFNTDGRSVVPLLDYIADFSSLSGSWESRVQSSALAARNILDAWQPGPMFVEFALDEPVNSL
jgi:hypothetical protein